MIVRSLKEMRSGSANTIRYSKGRIQDSAQKPFTNCDENDGKKYEWQSLDNAIRDFKAVDKVLVDLFGFDAEPIPEAPGIQSRTQRS